VVGALHGDLARHAARLLALCALRRGRLTEAVLGTREWERHEPRLGPVLAVRGLALASARLPAAARELLEAAQAKGLVDSDGVAVDRTWVDAVLASAKLSVAREAEIVVQEFKNFTPKSWGVPLLESWIRAGGALDELLGALDDASARKLRRQLYKQIACIDSVACLEYAEHVFLAGVDPALTDLLDAVVARGELDLDDARRWSARVRAAGRSDACPLASLAATAGGPPVARVLAAAELIEQYADPRGPELLEYAARNLHTAAIRGVMHRLAAEAPSTLGLFITAVTRSAVRREAVAATLERGGESELADELRAV
jgi:hypothetical protein